MEKSKQSEEEIIKLGKKLVEELGLDNSVNTLGAGCRTMSQN